MVFHYFVLELKLDEWDKNKFEQNKPLWQLDQISCGAGNITRIDYDSISEVQCACAHPTLLIALIFRVTSQEEFINKYEAPSIPVVIHGCCDKWKANETWKRKVDSCPLKVTPSSLCLISGLI